MNIDTAYAACEMITRGEARNFSYGIRLLPAAQRRAMSAVYAVARRIDDIGDGDLSREAKRAALDALRTSLEAIAAGGGPAGADAVDPVLLAIGDVAARFPLPVKAFGEIIDGCLADVQGQKYESFDDLVGYCRCVAGAVGRLSVGIYSPADVDGALGPADALGVALQLTNILRDLREDRMAGRIYLPAEDLRRFDCRLDLDAAGVLSDPPDAFAALIDFQVRRAEQWYQTGAALLPMLDRRSAACTAAMAGIYHRLLRRIAVDPQAVRERRLSLPAGEKLAVAARALTRRTW